MGSSFFRSGAARLVLLSVLLSSLLWTGADLADAAPREQLTPPGQVTVVTINARQYSVVGSNRFNRLYELARALRSRPKAFDGGYGGGVNAPDVIVVQEISDSNLDILRHLLKERFSIDYVAVGSTEKHTYAKFLYNEATVLPNGPETLWADPCSVGPNPTVSITRRYQFIRFQQVATSAPFVVAGLHLHPRYAESPAACRRENIDRMRAELAGETAPTIIAGDFNQKPVRQPLDCDPKEKTRAQPWWAKLVHPADGRHYADAVRKWHRRHGQGFASEWTHKQPSVAKCTGKAHVRHGRIDYLFAAGTVIAEAHTDHPGWARHRHPVYSDHRFVWGRFVIEGPSRPDRPTTELLSGGRVEVTWNPVPGAEGWVLYRALGDHAYDALQTFDGSQTNFTDIYTESGRRYKYAVAAVGASGGQGLESLGRRQWVP